MKKFLGSVLALALLLVASQAKADLLKGLKFNGSVEMDATSAQNVINLNTQAGSRIGAAQTRVLLGADWDLLDDVHAKVTLNKNDRVYGSGDGAGANKGQSLTQIQNNVTVEQAYFKIDKVFGYVDSSFGRMFYGDEGDLVIYYGPRHNQYGMTVTAIDAGRFDYNGEKFYVTGVVGKQFNAVNAIGSNGGALQFQKDLRGLVAGTKGMENVEGKVYLYNSLTHMTGAAAPQPNDNLYVAGLKVKGKLMGAYGSIELAQNFGSNRVNTAGTAALTQPANYEGRALLADVGYKADVGNIGTFNPWGELGIGTGGSSDNGSAKNTNFQSIATDYRPGAIYGRFDTNASLVLGSGVNVNTASNGLTNRVIYGFGVKVTPSAVNKLTAGLAFWDYRFYQLTAADKAAAKGNRHIGSEIDLTGEWKHSENVSFNGALGTFQSGGYVKNQNTTGTSPAFLASLNVAVKF